MFTSSGRLCRRVCACRFGTCSRCYRRLYRQTQALRSSHSVTFWSFSGGDGSASYHICLVWPAEKKNSKGANQRTKRLVTKGLYAVWSAVCGGAGYQWAARLARKLMYRIIYLFIYFFLFCHFFVHEITNFCSSVLQNMHNHLQFVCSAFSSDTQRTGLLSLNSSVFATKF